ncbi:MAG TPA: metalloregulator ArsR/SmtB family transcription factor [Ktedonobacteraceae bacterium]
MVKLERIVHAAQLFSDPLRVRILQELERQAFSVNDLATRLGVPQPRISSHLGLLRDVGWVFVIIEGRQRRYSIALPEIQQAMQALESSLSTHMQTEEQANLDSQTSAGASEADRCLREARTCYDHLAGIVGVSLCDALLKKGWLVSEPQGLGKHQPAFVLTAEGAQELSARGVVLPATSERQRRFAYACPDWTEGRHHIGGLLGVALLRYLEERKLIHQQAGTRIVNVEGDILRLFA